MEAIQSVMARTWDLLGDCNFQFQDRAGLLSLLQDRLGTICSAPGRVQAPLIWPDLMTGDAVAICVSDEPEFSAAIHKAHKFAMRSYVRAVVLILTKASVESRVVSMEGKRVYIVRLYSEANLESEGFSQFGEDEGCHELSIAE